MFIQTRSELSFVSTFLPNGLESNNNHLTGVATVYDSLLAYDTLYLNVQVNPLIVSVSELSNFFDQQLAANTGNSIIQNQIISSVGSVLNVVNCSLVDWRKCSSLNRLNCSTTSQTCGTCKSGYSGESGDSNTKCILPTSIPVADGSVCNANSNCGVQSYCLLSVIPHVCTRLPKECPGGCSGHGSCSFSDAITGNPVASCKQGDGNCEAVCNCNGNYTSTDCSITWANLLAKQSIRNLLIANLQNITALSNPSSENLVSWSNSIASMTQVTQEVTLSSANSVINIANTILNNAGSGSVVSSALTGTVSALDAVANHVSKDNLLSMVNSYGSIVANEMYPGQSSNDVIKSNFRTSSIIVGNGANTELSTPVSYVEALNNVKPMKLSLPNNTDSTKHVATTTVLMDAALYNVSGLNSNPLHMSMSELPCVHDGHNGCSMVFTLFNNEPADVQIITNPNQLQSFVISCEVGIARTVTHNCNNGYIINEYCNGSFTGSFKSVCNTNYSVSVCNSLGASNGVSSAGCTVLNYTSTQTMCKCPLVHSNGHRRLVDNNTSGVSVSLVSMLSTVASNFENTWESAGTLTTSSVLKGIRVLAVTGAIGLFAIIGILFGYQSDVAYQLELKSADKSQKQQKASTAGKEARRNKLILEAIERSRIKSTFEERLIEQALPEAMHEVSLKSKFISAIKSKHKWLSIVFHYSSYFPRVLRVLSLTTAIISMLFIQAVMYPISHPDNGICEAQTSEVACYAQPPAIGSGSSKCVWSSSSSSSDSHGSCTFRPPGDGKTLLYCLFCFYM